MTRSYSEGMQCVRYMLFTTNFMFLMIGFLLICIGSLIKLEYSDFEIFMEDHFFSPANLTMAIGCIIMFVALFGCMGAIKESTCLINLVNPLFQVAMEKRSDSDENVCTEEVSTVQVSWHVSTSIDVDVSNFEIIQTFKSTRKTWAYLPQGNYDAGSLNRYHPGTSQQDETNEGQGLITVVKCDLVSTLPLEVDIL